jgi:hypothetical protein
VPGFAAPAEDVTMESLVGNIGPEDLVRLWTRAVGRIVGYGFVVEYSRLEPPRTGIFDGLKITIDPTVDFEMQCFILLHLFGHLVQWLAPSYRPEIRDVPQEPLEPFLEAVRAYEHNAARFALRLMHDAGITDLDRWFSDFAETDWKYVDTFYRTGSIPSWQHCVAPPGGSSRRWRSRRSSPGRWRCGTRSRAEPVLGVRRAQRLPPYESGSPGAAQVDVLISQ